MQKGTAIVGFFLSFVLGVLVMYGVQKSDAIAIGPAGQELAAGKGDVDHSNSPIPVGAEDPQWGNADALVTIVEISDFQCPFCSRVNPTLKQVKDKYGPDKVRIVWKHNPLPFHKEARPAHEAAAAVHALAGSEAFWKFHDLVFENQKALTEDNFVKWAKEAGVDEAKFKAELKNKKHAAKVDQDLALARKIGARGTPNFRINGVELSGAQPFAKFQQAIDAQLEQAEALVKKGTPKNQVSLKLTEQNAKNAPAEDKAPERQEDTTIWRVPVAKDDPVAGPDDALVTIVMWSDFQCPFCARVEPTLDKLKEKYGKDLRIVWKDNALPFHKQAKPAATLARVAYAKGGNDLFWKAHKALFENQKSLNEETYQKISGELGLNWAEVKRAIDTDQFDKKISESMELASDLNARGTPHFFINGRRLAGAQPQQKFEELVDLQLKAAKGLVGKGVARNKVYDELMKTAKGPPEPERRDVPAPTKDNPTKGSSNAKVVVQIFSDFECPYCNRVLPTLKQIEKEYGNQVQLVWRNMPLPFHKNAKLAGEAAQEVYVQKGADAFWQYHDLLFANQKQLTREDLEKYAQQIPGLDIAKFKQALDKNVHAKRVEEDMEVASKAGVRGTPAFTINGYFLSGAQPYPQFEKLIKLALKEK